ELRDRFGPLPDDALRLLLVSELRALGAQAGLELVLVKGDEARLTFRRDAHPRLAGLTAALDAVQFEAEVRRPAPLSLRLRRLGGEAIGPGLVRAGGQPAQRRAAPVGALPRSTGRRPREAHAGPDGFGVPRRRRPPVPAHPRERPPERCVQGRAGQEAAGGRIAPAGAGPARRQLQPAGVALFGGSRVEVAR